MKLLFKAWALQNYEVITLSVHLRLLSRPILSNSSIVLSPYAQPPSPTPQKNPPSHLKNPNIRSTAQGRSIDSLRLQDDEINLDIFTNSWRARQERGVESKTECTDLAGVGNGEGKAGNLQHKRNGGMEMKRKKKEQRTGGEVDQTAKQEKKILNSCLLDFLNQNSEVKIAKENVESGC
ncbi:hypothetical protein L1887_40231 [Cichorium endivia]|nr:hypothetical protein L1887_40231 [Cichorium endivia]